MEPSENEIKTASAHNNPADAPSGDVLEHQRMVEALRHSEAVLKEALRAAQMGTWEWDLDADTTTWDENLFRIAGLDPKQTVPQYKEHPTLFIAASWDQVKSAVDKAIATGTPYELDLEMIRPDGSLRWVIDRGAPRRDASGRITHLYGTLQDITERKQAEEALRRSEQRYTLLFSQMVVGFTLLEIIYDEKREPCDYRQLEVNPAFETHTGLTRDRILGKTIREVLPDIEPFWIDTYAKVAATGKAVHFEHYAEPLQKWFEVTAFRTGPDQVGVSFADITERRKAEQQMRLFEALLFQSRDIILFVRHADGRIVGANHAAVQAYGYTREDLLELLIADLRVSESAEIPRALMDEAGADGVLFEAVHKRKDGALFPVEVSSRGALIDGDLILLSVVRDITERKCGEEALRAAEEKFRTAFNACPEAMVLCSFPEGVHLEVNQAYLQASGFSREEVVGKSTLEIGIAPNPEELGRMAESSMKDGKLSDFETVLRWKNGKTVHAIISAERMEFGGTPCLLVVAKDITERKRAEEALRASEERFRLFMDNSPTISWMKDEQGRYVYVSDTHEARVGVRIKDHLGQTDYEIYPPAIAEQFRRNDRAVLDMGHPIEVFEETPAPDGKVCTWLTYKFPIQDASGQVFVGGIGVDITEHKQMEKDLQTSFDQLRALAARLQSVREEERKRVAREIHDQLGQALTAIKIDLSSLVHELPEGAKPSSRRTDSMLQMVDESIRVVRRISTELRPGILDDLGLVAAIEWAGEDFESRTGTKCILHLPQEEIVVDPEQATAIFRIFQETLTNVARHAGATAVKVSFAKQGDGLMLEVHDNGNGISEEKLRAGKSLGILGMRERAMILGGEVNIKGISGSGTTVTVRIPGMHGSRREQRID